MATVLLTGASGFLGSHTVQLLLDRGHRVRALVRSRSRLAAALGPLGVDPDDERIEAVVGDMTDASTIEEAVSGCEAAVHAAATYSYKRRDREAMARDNALGTRAVLEAGRNAGCRVLVHVSSTVALARPGGVTLDHKSPLGPGLGPYSDSKVASERVARALQDSGAPVTIVNPGGILGPHDPYLGETDELVLQILQGRLPVFPRGLNQYVDVRDTAAVIAAAVDADPGGRYLVPGEARTDLHAPLREATGRGLHVLHLPPRMAELGTLPGYLTGWSFLPGATEGARILGCGNPVDSSITTARLGVQARPLLESLRDTVRWLVDSGHLVAKHAGNAL